MEAGARRSYLTELPPRLSAAIGMSELVAATRPPANAGIARTFRRDRLLVGERSCPSPVPRTVLRLVPAVDARDLCEAWGISRPVAVSGDVHQSEWRVLAAGNALPDPHAPRGQVAGLAAGRWNLHLVLTARPEGRQPTAIAGASPAYDIWQSGGAVGRLEVSLRPVRSALVDPVHADARSLLEAMAGFYPAWRPGWEVGPGAEFVIVYAGDRPIAGAAIENDGRGTAWASRLCVDPDRLIDGAGSALLDLLEAVAIDHRCGRLCLDGSVFLHRAVIPYTRHGYVVAPPYDGDADETVWAERSLVLPSDVE